MFSLVLLLTMLVPALVAVYTWNYARWAAKQNLRRGAWGLRFLALATIGVPFYVVWWGS